MYDYDMNNERFFIRVALNIVTEFVEGADMTDDDFVQTHDEMRTLLELVELEMHDELPALVNSYCRLLDDDATDHYDYSDYSHTPTHTREQLLGCINKLDDDYKLTDRGFARV